MWLTPMAIVVTDLQLCLQNKSIWQKTSPIELNSESKIDTGRHTHLRNQVDTYVRLHRAS